MDKGSIADDITEKVDTKRSAVEKAPTQNSQPLTHQDNQKSFWTFSGECKKTEAKTFDLGIPSPYFFSK